MWDAVNVAFEGPEQFTGEPENLPLPGSMTSAQSGRRVYDSHDGVVVDSAGAGPFEHEMYVPYGDSNAYCGDGTCSECGAGCGDGMCEPGCGCGCGGDVGCAGEPGCGCSQCNSKDLFCLGYGDDESCHTIRVRLPKWQELMVFGGVQGFKGPYDQSRDSGNFGFHEGFNSGWKIPFTTAGYQIGYRGVHSQLNGDKDTGIADPHTQQFVTFGVFQRARDGIQAGVVWDMLRDERFESVDFHQLRGELSLMDRGCHEYGVSVTVHMNEHEPFPADDDDSSIIYQASDQYLLFYRKHGPRGGEGRFYGGFNDDDDGIIGADLMVPLHDRWSLSTAFTYLIPAEHAGQEGAAQEAWNISTALVWHWDCRARRCHSNCYRPLFNVADYGYLIVDERLGAPATD
jgi:hypothetical protein